MISSLDSIHYQKTTLVSIFGGETSCQSITMNKTKLLRPQSLPQIHLHTQTILKNYTKTRRRKKVNNNRLIEVIQPQRPTASPARDHKVLKVQRPRIPAIYKQHHCVVGKIPSQLRTRRGASASEKAKISAQQHRRRRYDILCKLLIALSELLLLEKSVAKAFLPMLGRVPLAVSICFINQPCSSFLCFQKKEELLVEVVAL